MHTYLTDTAVVCWLILCPPMPNQQLPSSQYKFTLHLTLFECTQQTIPGAQKDKQSISTFTSLRDDVAIGSFLLDHLKKLVIRHFDVPGQVPREVDHWDDGFDTLQFVPFIALHSQFVLMG